MRVYSPVDAYILNGQYVAKDTLINKLEEAVHNKIRGLITESNGHITLADTVTITDFILANRKEFVDLLNYSVED